MYLAIKLSIMGLIATACLAFHPGDTDRSFGRLPLYFVENRGQMAEEVGFYVQGSDKTLYFTSHGVTFGITIHFAFCCNNPFDFVSNPVAIEVVK